MTYRFDGNGRTVHGTLPAAWLTDPDTLATALRPAFVALCQPASPAAVREDTDPPVVTLRDKGLS